MIANGVPRISVCMATYNGALFLSEQIESILLQLSESDELLISDDASTDATLETIAAFAHDSRVVLVAGIRAGGVVRNFERVLSFAKGDLIVLSDQDDVWLPGKIDTIRRSLQNADLVMLDGFVVDADLKQTGQRITDVVPPRSGFMKNFYKNSYVGCCMAFRAHLLKIVLPFPAGVVWHDWLLALVAESRFRCVRSAHPSILYRRHGSNHSPTGEGARGLSVRTIVLRLKMAFALLTVAMRTLRHGFWKPS